MNNTSLQSHGRHVTWKALRFIVLERAHVVGGGRGRAGVKIIPLESISIMRARKVPPRLVIILEARCLTINFFCAWLLYNNTIM